jgi:hypothetical protein
MKTKFYKIALLCIAFIGMASVVNAQTKPTTPAYNPFTAGNLSLTADGGDLNDGGGVVDGSYHKYIIPGDQNFGTSKSTFVWYVQGGELGTYDAGTGTWTAATGTAVTGSGKSKEYTAEDGTVTIGGTDYKNWSEVWVKWDNASEGYIAVYEVSPNMCIVDDQIIGYKVSKLNAVEAWFAQATSEACSGDDVSFEIGLSIDPDGGSEDSYYPLTVSYTEDGTAKTVTITKDKVSVDAPYIFNLDKVPGFTVADVNADEKHTFVLIGVTDKNGAVGTITGGKEQHEITIHHLPQTGAMVQN